MNAQNGDQVVIEKGSKQHTNIQDSGNRHETTPARSIAVLMIGMGFIVLGIIYLITGPKSLQPPIRETVIVPQTVVIKETAQTIIQTVIVKETALPPQKETVIVKETVQVTSSANNSPKLSLLLNPELTPTPKALNLTGNWNWSVQVEKTIDQNGVINRSTGTSNWLVKLSQSGSAINGELLGAESDICKALFKGFLNGNKLTLEARAAGNCCANAITKYDLIVQADQGDVTITGDFKPVNPPIKNCTMWWASVTGSREK